MTRYVYEGDPRRCAAVAPNSYRCVLVKDHEGAHCAVGDDGWLWFDASGRYVMTDNPKPKEGA